jgi:CXXX repeat peptide maturase
MTKKISVVKYLIVLLDHNATSFCYYENNQHKLSQGKLMPVNTLKQIVDYAEKNRFAINFIYPDDRLPKSYDRIIEKTEHAKIVPLNLMSQYRDAVYVINDSDKSKIESIKKNSTLNLIVRLKRTDLTRLSEILHSLYYRYKRLNLILLDIPGYNQADFDEFNRQLEIIEKSVTGFYTQGQSMELNFISDRLLLNKMNNCDAGIKHVTFAPNGRFYVCPGFYYQDTENHIGDLEKGFEIKNNHLLSLEFAPICRNCDAYHCKRCVFLNNISTMEVNTPSHEQCVLSHLERNTSKRILDSPKLSGAFQNATPIPELNFLDPIETITNHSKPGSIQNRAIQNETHEIPENLSENILPLEEMTDRDILIEIYKMQKEILKRHKNKN